jgi:WD40 repeat protein
MKKYIITIIILLLSIESNYAQDEIIWQKGLSHLGICSKAIISPKVDMIANSLNNLIQLRDSDGNELTTLDGHDELVTDIVFSADGNFLFSGAGNVNFPEYIASIIQWNVNDYNLESAFEPDIPENYFYVESIDVSSDGNLLAGLFIARTQTLGKFDRTIFIWNIGTAEILAQFSFEGDNHISKVKFSNGKLFFNLGEKMAMIETNNFTLVKKLGENQNWHNIFISNFDISGDSKYISSIDLEGNCKLFNLEDDTISLSFNPISEGTLLNQVLFGKDDDYLIFINSLLNNMAIYNLKQMELYHLFAKHTSALEYISLNQQKDKALLTDKDNLYYINLTYEKTIDIKEEPSTNTFEIFPNPVVDEIKLLIENHPFEEFDYKILNYLGQEIKSGKFFNNNIEMTINIADFQTGYYTLFLSNANVKYKKSFIKLN